MKKQLDWRIVRRIKGDAAEERQIGTILNVDDTVFYCYLYDP